MSRVLIVVFLLAILAWPALALDPARSLDLYDLDVWRDGLPQYLVRAVCQTRDGYLWFATMEGLVRFNGLTFEIFDQRNTPALRSARIRALYEARDGALWIATVGGGVVRRQNGRFTVLTKENGLADDSVISIVETSDGLWIGTANGLNRYRDGRMTQYLAGQEISALAAGRDGSLWIGTTKGLYRNFAPVVPDPVDALAIARDGTVWAGARDHVLRIAPGRATRESIALPIATVYVHHVIEDSRGTIWLATSPGGLLRLRDGKFDLLDKTKGLPSSSVRALAEDREGSLWIGTDSGLARLEDLKFVTYTARHGLPEDNVRVVTEARDGGLWVGTYGGGLGRLRDGRMTRFTTKDGLASDKIDALAALRDGTLLVSTPRGVQTLRDGRFEAFTLDRPTGPDVRVMLESRNGDLWLGTYDGLLQVRGRTILQRLRTGLKPHSEDDVFDAISRTLGVQFRKRDVIGGGNRILLVDDDLINLHIASQLLSQLGFAVTVAHDGREALALLDASPFDAVLLDIEMPGMDGRATVKEIRAREACLDLPVIAMSAHGRDVLVAGMTDYLAKPIDAAGLGEVMARYLGSAAAKPPR
jgi:ligand-binding sensor domain-containing protein/ActR/RegA family two-component response regulator